MVSEKKNCYFDLSLKFVCNIKARFVCDYAGT